MGTFILNAPAFVYREEAPAGKLLGKLVTHKRGDEVDLDDEQVQRLRAGQEGSPFVTQEQFDRLNRTSFPTAEEEAASWPEPQASKLGEAAGDGTPLPAPMSTTAADAGPPLVAEKVHVPQTRVTTKAADKK
jgi:hypothetical protein